MVQETKGSYLGTTICIFRNRVFWLIIRRVQLKRANGHGSTAAKQYRYLKRFKCTEKTWFYNTNTSYITIIGLYRCHPKEHISSPVHYPMYMWGVFSTVGKTVFTTLFSNKVGTLRVCKTVCRTRDRTVCDKMFQEERYNLSIQWWHRVKKLCRNHTKWIPGGNKRGKRYTSHRRSGCE